MQTLIISGGSIETGLALAVLKENHFEHIIAVDAGLRFCFEQKIRPTRIVGDFDTLEPGILERYETCPDIEIRRFNPVKDSTDTQIAVELALELGSSSITILGGTGTRLDHVLGNIQTMALALEKGAECVLLDPNNRIRLIRGEYRIRRDMQYGRYVSLLPLTTEVSGVTLKGMKYPLEEKTFTVYDSAGLGVSNEIAAEEAVIRIGSGVMILIESKD